jgi:hypothetical protein
MHIHTYAYTYVHTYIHTHIHMQPIVSHLIPANLVSFCMPARLLRRSALQKRALQPLPEWYVCVCMCVCVYACIHLWSIYIYIYIYLYVCMYVCIHTQTSSFNVEAMLLRICSNTCSHNVRSHAHIHTCTHAHTWLNYMLLFFQPEARKSRMG